VPVGAATVAARRARWHDAARVEGERQRVARAAAEATRKAAELRATSDDDLAAECARRGWHVKGPDDLPSFSFISRRAVIAFCRCGADQMVDPAHTVTERASRRWLLDQGWSHDCTKVEDEGWACPRCADRWSAMGRAGVDVPRV
jgi:hypothetical protein